VQRFGALLAAAIAARGLNQKQFAERVHVHPTLVGKLIAARRAPNWKRAPAWASALGLTGEDREVFIDAMHLAAASPRVQALVRRLMESSPKTSP
jgi:transcriptional regulator with XRE-family HTH domain